MMNDETETGWGKNIWLSRQTSGIWSGIRPRTERRLCTIEISRDADQQTP
jgi:hypothetical protein